MHTILLLSQLLLALLCFKLARNISALPIASLRAKDWPSLLELRENANTTASYGNTEYYESFILPPIIVKMDSQEDFAARNLFAELKSKTKEVLLTAPQPKDLWIDVKSFFNNDVKNFSKKIANKCNPMPTISKAIESVQRSTTWNGISSFFNKSYARFAEISDNVVSDVKKYL